MSRKIVWEHWQDPFLPILEESERLKKQQEDSYDDGYEIKENIYPQIMSRTPIAMTNWGYFPITDINRPGNIMDFWLGHTNFDITNDLYDAIESVRGVEAVEIQTRYRFRIAIGKMFNSAKTKKRIEYVLCTLPRLVNMGLPIQTIREINEIHKDLKNNNKYWTMMILPNASVETFSGLNEEEVLEKYTLFKEAVSNTGGIAVRHKNGRTIKRTPS